MAGTRSLILTEGGSGIGMGHITRCLSLYSGLEEACKKPELLINAHEAAAAALEKYRAENINFRICDWNGGGLAGIIAGAETVFVDSYLAPRAVYETICASARAAVFLDDYNRLDYPGGLVVNGAICAADINYSKTGSARYLLGPKYQPLRKEFWDIQAPPVKSEVENIMITFGGGDIGDLAPAVLKLVCADFPSLKKHVIIGGNSPNRTETENGADNNTFFYYDLSASEMLGVILKSDAAISAAGQTACELARAGIPAVIVQTAGNQRYNIAGLVKTGTAEFAGNFDEPDIAALISKKLRALAANAGTRREMSENGKKLIDGNGVRRIMNEAFELNRGQYL